MGYGIIYDRHDNDRVVFFFDISKINTITEKTHNLLLTAPPQGAPSAIRYASPS